jgi:hypothetical protein
MRAHRDRALRAGHVTHGGAGHLDPGDRRTLRLHRDDPADRVLDRPLVEGPIDRGFDVVVLRQRDHRRYIRRPVQSGRQRLQ